MVSCVYLVYASYRWSVSTTSKKMEPGLHKWSSSCVMVLTASFSNISMAPVYIWDGIHQNQRKVCLRSSRSIRYCTLFGIHFYKCASFYFNFCFIMMNPSNGNIFRITGLLCGELTGHRWKIALKSPVPWSFDVFCDLRLNKQWRRRLFEAPSRPFCHCNDFRYNRKGIYNIDSGLQV